MDDGYLDTTDRKKAMMISGGSSAYLRYRACHKNPRPVVYRPSGPESPCCKVADREPRDRSRAARGRRA
jgi:hypothetical protein